MTKSFLRLGTRGSGLALAQAKLAVEAIQKKFPEIQVEIAIIHTSGDKDRVGSLVALGGEGLFVKELELALVSKQIDFAVHSLKDVPDVMDERLTLAGFLKREMPYDVLVSNGKKFFELPRGAKIGTGSPRRVLQLKSLRPDIYCMDLRGNLETRIAKVHQGELDAILLGAAGLHRLNLGENISQIFMPEEMTPAIGQGIVGLQCVAENESVKKILEAISDDETVMAARVERRWMHLLGGGCRVPMGALLQKEDEKYHFHVYLADPQNGQSERREKIFSLSDLNGEALDRYAEFFAKCCHDKHIPLPSEVDGEHALMNFWGKCR